MKTRDQVMLEKAYSRILSEETIKIPIRSREQKEKNYVISIQRRIQEYVKNGSKGNLQLNGTPINSLPDNLEVGGSLYLDDTPITSLPRNLKVGGNLDLRYTQISSLPDNLEVGGDLYLNDILAKNSFLATIKVGGQR